MAHHASSDDSVVKVRRISDGFVFESALGPARELIDQHRHDYALVPRSVPSARQIVDGACSHEELSDLCREHRITVHPNATRDTLVSALVAALEAGADASSVMSLAA